MLTAGKSAVQPATSGASMLSKNSDEQPTPCVVVEPCHDDRQGYDSQGKDGEVCQKGDPTRSFPSTFASGQKVGQVPAAP